MKRIFLIFLGIIILLAGAAGFALKRLDGQALRGKVAELTQAATGKPLHMVEAPVLSFMPPGIHVGKASWGYENGKPAEYGLSLDVRSATARLDLLPLLWGRVVVQEVRLDRPQVTLRPENAATRKSDAPLAIPEVAVKKISTPPLELGRLNISNGALTLEVEPGHMVKVDAFNAAITDLRSGAEASVKLDMGVVYPDLQLNGNFSLAGYIRLVNSARGDSVSLRQTKLSFTPLGGLVPPELGTIQMALDGSYGLADSKMQLETLKVGLQGLTLEVSGQGTASRRMFSGSVKMGFDLRTLGRQLGVSIPEFGKSTVQCALEVDRQNVTLSKLSGTLGGVSLSGDLALKEEEAVSLRGVLRLGHLLLDTGKQENTADTVSAGVGIANTSDALGRSCKSTAAGVKADKSLAVLAGLLADAVFPQVDLDIMLASLTMHGVRMEEVRSTVRGQSGKNTEYVFEPLELRLASGGRAQGTARVALPPLTWALSGRVDDVAIGPLWAAIKDVRPVEGTLEGECTLNATGASMVALLSSLNGKGNVTIIGGRFNSGTVLPAGLPAREALLAQFERLHVPFAIQKGLVNIAGATLAGKGVHATGKGIVRLQQGDINMTATLSVLGMQVPVLLTGPLTNISYRADPKWAARMAGTFGKR